MSEIKRGTREKIVDASLDLFNYSDALTVTTNHIAARLAISPGNLYYHFRNKEEIIRELFVSMCNSTYQMWLPKDERKALMSPVDFIERSLEVFWTYRFFHRNMYSLRKNDAELSKLWRRHWRKSSLLLTAAYRLWVKQGLMRPVDSKTMSMITEVILITSSAHFQFFESIEKPATRKPSTSVAREIALFLAPYATPAGKALLAGN